MGGSIVSFSATPQQLETLHQAVESYCLDCGITDESERLYIAEMVIALFELGLLDPDHLREGLDAAIGPCLKPTRH
jgi:hypothetical protein